MTAEDLDAAMGLLCKNFDGIKDVEILLVGGAAGMLTGLLGADRTTVDCDVIEYEPDTAWGEVESLAQRIGKDLGLPANWLNSDVKIRSDCLPNDWKTRRQLILRGNRLSIYAISRVDLIAMKFIAHRPQDLEDLAQLAVTKDDIEFVKRYLANLSDRGTAHDQILETAEIADSWLGPNE